MPTLNNYQFSVNNQTVGGGATLPSGSTVSVTEITGLDLPDPNSTVTVRSGSHGSYVTSRYHKERIITISGRINSSAANYAIDTYALKAIFDTDPTGNPTIFYLQLPGMPQQIINCYTAGVRYSVRNVETAVGMVDFIATLIAGDPRIYSTATQTTGAKTTSTFAVTNSGIVPAPTVIRFDGPITNPQVTDNTTGKTFRMVTVLASGHFITVNSLDRTVLLDGVTSTYASVDSSNNAWIEISGAGVNLLSANASSIETDASAWAVSTNCAIARSTAQHNDGAAALSLTSSASGTMSATTLTGLNGVPVYPNVSYTAIASFRSAVSARSTNVGISWYNAAGTFISTSTGSNVTDGTGAFSQVTVTATAPATAAYGAIVATVVSTGGVSEVHYVDTIQLSTIATTTWVVGGGNSFTYSNSSGAGTTTLTWQDCWL